MNMLFSPRRSVLLALSLLSACAAGDVRTSPAVGAAPSAAPSDPPPGLAGAWLTGSFAASTGDTDFAASQLLRVAAADPHTPEVQQQALLISVLAGRPEAVRLASRLPGLAEAALVLATNDARLGRWDSASARFRALPRQGVAQVLQPLLIAWAEDGAGRPDAALATLRPLAEGPPNFRGVYALHMAMIADFAGRTADAARFYKVGQAEHGAIELELAPIIASWEARQGHTAEARRTITDLVAAADDLAVAQPALLEAVAKRKIRGPGDGIAEAYLALAVAVRAQEASDLAKVLLQLALDMRPDFTAARLVYADVLDNAHQPDAALRMLTAVGGDDPLAAVVRLHRISLMDQLGQTDQALAALSALEHEMPDRPEAFMLEGDIQRGRKQFALAVVAYDKAAALIPDPTRANWPLFYRRGIALDRSGQWPRAEADFRHALSLSPDEPFVANYLAYSWTERGENLTEARAMLERAAKMRPNDGAIVDSLGWVLLRQGDVPGAVRYLERATELEAVDPTINGHLGDAYLAAGRKREAEFQWRRALTFGPDPEDVPKLEAKLRDADKGASMAPTPTAAGTGGASAGASAAGNQSVQ